jgi:hypothetical protein
MILSQKLYDIIMDSGIDATIYESMYIYETFQEELLNVWDSLEDRADLAIYGAGNCAEAIIRILGEEEIAGALCFIDNGLGSKGNNYLARVPVITANDVKDSMGIKKVLLTTFRHRDEMKQSLVSLHDQPEFIDIYAIIAKRNIRVRDDFFKCDLIYPTPGTAAPNHHDIFPDIINVRNQYNQTNYRSLKIFHLNKLINLCLYIKDFVKASQYIDEYAQCRYDGYENYTRLMDNIRQLIAWMKKELNAKTNRNICNVILDGVGKNRAEKLTWLQDLRKDALSFTNAWVRSPYTQDFYHSIFTGSDIVTGNLECGLKVFESPMPKLKRFLDNGFKVRMFSNLNKSGFKNFISNYHSEYIPNCSRLIWDYLDYALDAQEDILCFVHIFMETHYPYYTIYNDDEVFVSSITSANPIELSQSYRLVGKCIEMQIDAGLKNVDVQLRYYFDGTDFDLVITNDHGDGERDYSLDVSASILTLRSKCIPSPPSSTISSQKIPQVYNKLFSYVDLLDMEFALTTERKLILPEREFVLLALDPLYMKDFDRLKILNWNIDPIKGHVAVLTDDDYYVRHLDGQERYFLRSDLDTDLSGDPQYVERMKYLYNLLDKRDYAKLYEQEKYKKFHNYLRVFTQYEGKRNN